MNIGMVSLDCIYEGRCAVESLGLSRDEGNVHKLLMVEMKMK